MIRAFFNEWKNFLHKDLTEKDKQHIKNVYEELFNGKVIEVKTDGTVDIQIKNTIYRRMFMSSLGVGSPNSRDSCNVTFHWDCERIGDITKEKV